MNKKQKILVFQQNGSGEKKIKGIGEHGNGRFDIEIVSIEEPLPDILDDTADILPRDLRADIVLDFLTHPDLSYDLAERCRRKNIPVVASGKKLRVEGVAAPPT